jgi:hypothetical protein
MFELTVVPATVNSNISGEAAKRAPIGEMDGASGARGSRLARRRGRGGGYADLVWVVAGEADSPGRGGRGGGVRRRVGLTRLGPGAGSGAGLGATALGPGEVAGVGAGLGAGALGSGEVDGDDC